jgi:Leucine-rich repeat (LRR) protein
MKNLSLFYCASALIFNSTLSLGQNNPISKESPGNTQNKITLTSVPRPNVDPRGPYQIRPVFKTLEDSANYYSIESIVREGKPGKNTDSLRNLLMRLSFERVARYRIVYGASQGFTQLESISEIQLAAIKKISIYRAKRLPKKLMKCKAVEEVEFVQCTIKKLPKRLGKLNIKSVKVHDNKQKSTLKLAKNKSIEILQVRECNPNNIPKRFERWSRLRSLDLGMNELTEVPKSVFYIKSLKLLKLSVNKITLNGYQFPVNSTLEALELTNNPITKVPSSIGNLSGLTSLNMYANGIQEIEQGIGRLQKLTQLSFYNNEIKYLPKDIYDLKALKEIDLYYNQIERVDEAIGNLKNLEILYLANNKLLSVPDSISQLKSLRALYLHNNRISSLPEGISSLSELRILRVNKNNLMTLPEKIASLKALENFDVSQNKLRSLPIDFWSYPNLKILAMAANPWDEAQMPIITEKANELRKKNVVVHLSGEQTEN